MNVFKDALIGACLMGAIIVMDEMGGLGLGIWGRVAVFLLLYVAITGAALRWR